ncbi:MAG: hypothetical protein Q8O94_00680 [bacterium]|nr:hypothetical protein [bacterium]
MKRKLFSIAFIEAAGITCVSRQNLGRILERLPDGTHRSDAIDLIESLGVGDGSSAIHSLLIVRTE